MPANTITTSIADIQSLPQALKVHLDSKNISVLGDISDYNFLTICDDLSADHKKHLYEVVYKANIEFKFNPTDRTEDLPVLSERNRLKLHDAKFQRISDFEDVFYPDIYKLIGFGPAKELLVIILSSGVTVKFLTPNWSEEDWKQFVLKMVGTDLVSWEDIAITICSEANPPQVGTAVAEQVKHNYPPRQTMQHVYKWLYSQSGRCEVSGKRLWLEADHKIPKEQFIREGRDTIEANTLDNFQLLTKRENVIKRGSHRLGGLSFAPASAVLVYVLLRYQPKTFEEFSVLCRNHALTMADIRFREAWALAIWLSKEGLYELADEN